MRITSCPAADELSAFNLGKLPEDRLQTVAEHLAACPTCQTSLHALETQVDSLVAGLRQGAPEESYAEETAFREALEKAKSLTAERSGPEAAGAGKPPLGRLREYQLLEKLGQGGMGTLYKALHSRLKRVVALKVLPPERMHAPVAVARFQREMEAVGRLNHSHIVRATDAGEADGTHFLVMEFIDGRTLGQLVQACGPLPVAEACELIRQAALGLQHVHEHGLVHRDIKPSNLILSADGQVKVLDLGLALLKEEDTGAAELTATGQVMGTFDYMAPEQFGDTHAVDIRADVYSLGCTLYFLLAGKAPFSGPAYANRLQKMRAHAEAPAPPLREQRGDVPAGLAAVLALMLAKEAGDRFATPAEVAAALAPFAAGCNLARLSEATRVSPAAPGRESNVLTGTDPYLSSALTGTTPSAPLPVAHAPGSPAIVPRVRRRWLAAAVAAAALVGAVVLLGAVYTLRTKHATLVVTVSEPDVKVLIDGQEKVTIDSKKVGRIELVPGEHKLAVKRGDEVLYTDSFTLKSGGEKVIDATWEPTLASRERQRPELHAPSPFDALSRDQIPPYELAVAGGGDPKNAPSELVAILGDSRMKHWSAVRAVAFSPDGKTLASGAEDCTVRLWDMTTGQQRGLLVYPGLVMHAVAFAPDGKLLASSHGSAIYFWDLNTGKIVRRVSGHAAGVTALAFSGDGKLLASGSDDKTVKLWDAATGETRLTLTGHGEAVYAVRFSPDGKAVASRSHDGTVKLWAVTGAERRTFKGMPGLADSLAFSPDGKDLAIGGEGGLKVWDVATGEERPPLRGRSTYYFGVAFSPDGQVLAAGEGWSGASGVDLWDISTGQKRGSLGEGPANGYHSLAFSPDGKELAAGTGDGRVRMWDLPSGQEGPGAQRHPGQVLSMALSPDGKLLATGTMERTVKLWDVVARREMRTLHGAQEGFIHSLCFTPQGDTLASGGGETVELLDLTSEKKQRTLRGHQGEVNTVAVSPDGKVLASGSMDHMVKLWDVESGQAQRTLSGHTGYVFSVAFSPDGKTLATRSVDGVIKLWNPATGEERATLATPASDIANCLAFSPDSKVLASWGGNSTVTLWDVATGERRRTLEGHQGLSPLSLAFSPDGKTLASAGGDGTVGLWEPEAPPGQRVLRQTLRLGPPGGWIRQVAFSPDGRYLLTLNGNGNVYVLRLAEAELAP